VRLKSDRASPVRESISFRKERRMELLKLMDVIKSAGGGDHAAEYAEALLLKLNKIEATGQYKAMLKQLYAARQFGDFRGRVLEANFADLFLRKDVTLIHEPRQGMSGDIDFRWDVAGFQIFIEMKLLRQADPITVSMNEQLACTGKYQISITDDTPDIGRIQRDIMAKSTIRKFNPKPQIKWVNLVAIDLCELQLGGADLGDCLLAAGGNPAAFQHYYREAIFREDVVGVFENASNMMLSTSQMNWLCKYQYLVEDTPHPRKYIHGVLFLFRHPQETSALSYDLSGFVVWNRSLVTRDMAEPVSTSLGRILPLPPKRD
jgi:hypothetical protein